MITTLETESGGESEGILRIEMSLPISLDELLDLRGWLDNNGWHVEVDQIDDWLNSQYLTCDTCGRTGSPDDGIGLGGPCQEPCDGVVVAVPMETS